MPSTFMLRKYVIPSNPEGASFRDFKAAPASEAASGLRAFTSFEAYKA
jgi:hypothetical protein